MSSKKEFESISFDLPKNQSNVIKVIGVGGGGSNAINHMFQQGIKGVDFYVCNTDAQALQNTGVPNKIQLGLSLTEGLGAGANPDIGEQSALESFEDISQMLDSNTKMVFITAGMGGGTGTGAAPIIAKMAKDLDILTVGIVTMPFQFEGKMRIEQSQIGIEKLRNTVDSLIVINNNKLREVYGNLGFKAGFSKADEVLSTAARGIAEVITHHYTQNIDLRDAKTVLSNSGTAIMGSARASGQNRAQDAISKALDSPLLNDNKITGAKNVLLLIVSGIQEITIDEIGEINDHIQNEAGHGANIIMGVGEDETLEESIAVTIIATGFNIEQQDEISNTETKKVIHALGDADTAASKKQAPVIEKAAPRKVEPPKIVRHTLNIEQEDDIVFVPVNKTPAKVAEREEESPIVPTTDALRGIDVVYESLGETDDFLIQTLTDSSSNDATTKPIEDDQVALTFDFPLTPAPKAPVEEAIISHDLHEASKDVEVNEYTEVSPKANNAVEVPEQNETVRYVLEDTQDAEPVSTKPIKNSVENPADDIVFEKKTRDVLPVKTTGNDDDIDPMDTPLSELKDRTAERRRKMKEFNYKFNNSKIDEIEKVPAYKRQGVNLHDAKHSSDTDISRTSINTDDNNDIQLRDNNSFLHDNVD